MIGATGMLGVPVAIALAEAGFEVTALARNPEHARHLLPEAISIVEADVRDEESLRRGMRGQDGLYLNLSISRGARKGDFHSEAQGLVHILAAAHATGIARIAYLSALVHDTPRRGWWVIDVWQRALARIKSCGIPYTIFYPSNFMETLAQRHGSGSIFVMLGWATYRNYWISGADFGRQAAKAFALEAAANREYYVQGPEPLAYDVAAMRYARIVGRARYILRLPIFLARIGGIVSRSLNYDAHIMQTVLSYPEVFKAHTTWQDLGEPSTTIEQFARMQRPD